MQLDKILSSIKTPAFIYDEDQIFKAIKDIKKYIPEEICRLLFALKSFSIIDPLYSMGKLIDGFSASSLFEAKLARYILGNGKPVHLTTPGLRVDEVEEISELCNFISFNSLPQFRLYCQMLKNKTSCGVRINPQMSFVKDKRYDPCRIQSKLGVPLLYLSEQLKSQSLSVKEIKGLHFHTNCESEELEQLISTLTKIEHHLPELLHKIEWINIGGGYLFHDNNSINRLGESLFSFRNKYDIEIYFEPGKTIVGDAGYIASTVIDLFENDSCLIAVLDTSVNHMPEVFEYQYKPSVMQESKRGKYKYLLAGSTCLAGDLFGMYSFKEPIRIGSQIIFKNMGAYTLVKANMFNGLNLPNIYSYSQDGCISLKKQFSYQEFIMKCGGTI